MYVFVGKYVNIFEKLKQAMDKAIKGDFSNRIDTDLKDEAGVTVKEFNQFADLTKRIEKRMEGEFETLTGGRANI